MNAREVAGLAIQVHRPGAATRRDDLPGLDPLVAAVGEKDVEAAKPKRSDGGALSNGKAEIELDSPSKRRGQLHFAPHP